MYCSISGVAPREPVLSKYGNIYERRLIEEHIQRTGACPVTEQPLTEDDLTEIKVNRVVKPRTAAATSIPAMLQTFQNEWDALMVETYELRRQLTQCRTELSAALYKQDAAERTVARLIRERDHALEMAKAGRGAGPAPNAIEADSGDVSAMELEGGGLSAAQEALLTQTASQLIGQRKSRTIPATLAPSATVGAYRETASHAPARKGLTAVARGKSLALGVADGNVLLWEKDKVRSTLKGHSKAISGLGWAADDALVSASLDGSVRIWKGTSCAHTLDKLHTDQVTGLTIHPCGNFFVSASRDQSWALVDLTNGAPIYTVAPAGLGANSACAFHPDGLLLATATGTSMLRLWDVKSKDNVVSFPAHAGALSSIAFSENGFHLATGGADSAVKLWDLRNLSDPVFATESTGGPVTSVAFDWSGRYLAAGGQDVQIYEVQSDNSVAHVTRLAGHQGAVTGLAWGDDARSLTSVSSDKTLKTYSE